ncbi:hypothetical protein DENSPDRAFT_563815 [Dentipellis sp. KUC8613]|nr:hypothetical protein DENSPDRAFT_563815 [Dentipellis sp. KUC8613]
MFGKIMPEMNVPRGTTRPIILPRLEFSPGLPASPGAPGTMLTNRKDILQCGPVSLWIKTVPDEGLWKYFGNYDFARSVQPLTPAEASRFDESVRHCDFFTSVCSSFFCSRQTVSAWAALLSSNAWDFSHAELRVRLWLRKVGAEATEAVVAHHVDLLRTKKSPIVLHESDIAEALRSWKETLHVVTMRCVGYDYDFLADMETRWRKWQAVQAVP